MSPQWDFISFDSDILFMRSHFTRPLLLPDKWNSTLKCHTVTQRNLINQVKLISYISAADWIVPFQFDGSLESDVVSDYFSDLYTAILHCLHLLNLLWFDSDLILSAHQFQLKTITHFHCATSKLNYHVDCINLTLYLQSLPLMLLKLISVRTASVWLEHH